MTLSAITDDATLRVLFWGGDAGVPSADAGETRTIDIANSDATIINAAKPQYTKVVAGAFVAMDQTERDAVDAVLDPVENVETTDDFLEVLDAGSEFDYGTVTTPFVIDMSNGNGLTQVVTLGASFTTAGDITILVGDGTRRIVLRVNQDVTGEREIAAIAWTLSGSGTIQFGSKGAPAFGSQTSNQYTFLVLDYRGGADSNGDLFIHYTDNIF